MPVGAQDRPRPGDNLIAVKPHKALLGLHTGTRSALQLASDARQPKLPRPLLNYLFCDIMSYVKLC